MRDSNQLQASTRWPKWAGYAVTALLEVFLTAGLVAVYPYLPLGDYPIVFMIPMVAAIYWFGEGPALLAFVLGLVAFDRFFVSPSGSLWPSANSSNDWAALAAYFFCTAVVGIALVLMARSQRCTRQLAEELHRSGEHTTSVLESIADAFFSVDREWRFTYANAAAERLAGMTRDEVLGERLWDLFPEAVGSRFYDEYHRAMAERAPIEFEEWYPRFGMCLAVRVYPSAEGLSVYFRDVTERKQAEQRQKLAARVLTELNKQALAEDSIRGILGLIKEFVEVEAAGIRLRRAGDFPFYVCDGYEENFLESEDRLCIEAKTGEVVMDEDGQPVPQCVCGIVLRSRIDPTCSFFTPGGSFWTNSIMEVLGSAWKESLHDPLRGRCDMEGYESLAIIPLKRGDEVLGLLHLSDKRPDRFTLDLIEFLESIGVSIGVALARKGAEEELRESEERLSRAQGIAHLGSWELDLVRNSLLWSDEVYRIFGLKPQEFGATYEAFLEAVHPDDRAAVDEAYSGSLREGRDTYDIEHRVVRRSDGDIRIVQERCEHIRDESGRIIRSIGMVHDITERKRAEETVTRQFSLLQQALVPPRPSLGGGYDVAAVYIPAFPGEQVGGDFHDVFTTESGQIGIVIGDVAGKGIKAAALAAVARSTVHSFAYELSSPGAALSHANAVVQSEQLESGGFVTVFLAVIDPATGRLSYARAGHPPAAIWRMGGQVEFLDEGDTVLGLFARHEYHTFEDNLNPGDKIILYTDGIMEARRGENLFDLEGIHRVLTALGPGTPEELAEGLLEAASEWAEGSLFDDIAILVIERTAGFRNSEKEALDAETT